MAPLSSLEFLPNEIIQDILTYIEHQAIKILSLVSKRLREQCLPFVFYHVKVSFSPSGLVALRDLAEAEHLNQHVVWFTYGGTDILDPRAGNAEQFSRELYPRRAYAEDETDHYYLMNGKMETFKPYEAVYPAFQPVAEGQRIVLDKGMDMDVVPSALCRFPKLAKLTLRYNMPAVEPRFFPMMNWMRSSGEEVEVPLERHLKVVPQGIRRARSCDTHVRTVEFGGSNNDGWRSVDRRWRDGELSTLFSESLRGILQDVEVLRLFHARVVLNEICTQPSFAHLREIDIAGYLSRAPINMSFSGSLVAKKPAKMAAPITINAKSAVTPLSFSPPSYYQPPNLSTDTPLAGLAQEKRGGRAPETGASTVPKQAREQLGKVACLLSIHCPEELAKPSSSSLAD
ncbi:hypothetical protein ACJ73_07213 [Blastomyces percursus]|uniref:F-box domain-containing protein n=1 Tax=Blastomyces percursus TaxID=1658174 RepID=A0A1J9R080_9EURO|nr:hypothetical protein ACJ73_07213 [Blastomyces percursus]